MSREAAAVARRAAEIQQQHGHCKGALSRDGRHCLWGSIRAAQFERYGMGFLGGTDGPIRQQLGLMFPESADWYFPGSKWNDEPATTETDVAKVLLSLADRLEIAP